MNYFVHPTAIIDEGAQIGHDTKIWHWVHVCSTAKIGDHCVLGQNVFVGHRAAIGNGVKIQNHVSVYEGVTLEDNVFCGPSVVFTNVINPRSAIERKQVFQNTLVKEGATIGANATVVCGHTIGRYALIGAGSVITKEVPDYALMVGNPAKQVGWVCRCGTKLKPISLELNTICHDCGETYLITIQACKPLRSDHFE